MDATSFVRIISAIIFIISDGKIKTRIFYITRIQSEREKVVNRQMRNLNLKIYQALVWDILSFQPPLKELVCHLSLISLIVLR